MTNCFVGSPEKYTILKLHYSHLVHHFWPILNIHGIDIFFYSQYKKSRNHFEVFPVMEMGAEMGKKYFLSLSNCSLSIKPLSTNEVKP